MNSYNVILTTIKLIITIENNINPTLTGKIYIGTTERIQIILLLLLLFYYTQFIAS